MFELDGEQNPFLRYREQLDCYAPVRSGELSDAGFVELVDELDQKIGELRDHGTRFRVTRMVDGSAITAQRQPGLRLSVKFESGNVAGSHKARHIFGVALHHLVRRAVDATALPDRLAIASCGNAAMAAATVAAALDRPIDVFVPTWADGFVIDELDELGASVHRCERRPDEQGDPCYLRFREAVDDGATPFSVQGTDTPTTFDGGRTLGWEIEEQVGTPDAIYVQVGGGALASAIGMALPDARLHPVQAEGCAPLERAWARLSPDFDFEAAHADPGAYMAPWDNPTSLATGILDDITYDWLPLLRLTRDSGGWPIVAPEARITEAWKLAAATLGPGVSATGTAGLAGLLHELPLDVGHAVVIFSGREYA